MCHGTPVENHCTTTWLKLQNECNGEIFETLSRLNELKVFENIVFCMSGNVFLSICHKRSLRDVIRSTAGFSFTNQFSQKHWHYTIRNGLEFTRHPLSRVDWLVRNRVSRSTNIQVDKPYLIGKHSKFISSNCWVVNLDKQFDKYCLST